MHRNSSGFVQPPEWWLAWRALEDTAKAMPPEMFQAYLRKELAIGPNEARSYARHVYRVIKGWEPTR